MGAQVVVSTPNIVRDGDHTLVSADVAVSGYPTVNVWYRCPVRHVAEGQAVDAFFVIALLAAMRRNATLQMPAPVSRDLLRQADTFQDIFTQWYPDEMTPVAVEAEVRTDAPSLPDDRGLGCCFTGGVDSFYSVLNPPEPLSRLVFVHGFDIPLRAGRFRRTVARRLNVAARQLDIPLLEVETNLRELTDLHGHWPRHVHGSALASVGLMLADDIGTLLIPSHGWSNNLRIPYGSHQVTDRLHGTDYLSVVHHATGILRIAKTKAVAEHPVGARHLRVCFKSRRALNCGTCFKCRRALLDLHALRLRKRVRTFDVSPSRQELVDSVVIDAHYSLTFAQGRVEYLRANGGPRDIVRALERAIATHHLQQGVDSLLPHLDSADLDNTGARAELDRLAGALAPHTRRSRWRRQTSRIPPVRP